MAQWRARLNKIDPVYLWVGGGVLAFFFGKKILELVGGFLKSISPDPGVESQEALPLTGDSPLDSITGRIVSPGRGDTVTKGGLSSFTYPMSVEVTNPFPVERRVLLKVTTHEYPNLMPETGSTFSEVVNLQQGRNIFKLSIRLAAVVNIGVTVPAYAQLTIDGRNAPQAVYYEIE